MTIADKAIVDPPKDGISTVCFAPNNPNLLAASSWDKSVTVYNTLSNTRVVSFALKAAVLDTAFNHTGNSLYAGGLDNSLSTLDLETGVASVIGKHGDAVRCVSSRKEMIISGSWDKNVKLWDPRARDSVIETLAQPDRVYALDVSTNIMAVVNAGRQIMIYDLRKPKQVLQKRDSSLKYMLRSIKCMAGDVGYTTSSIEGRIAVDYFDLSAESQARKFSFKCHRTKVNGVEIAHPVNALAYHPIHTQTFVSGGAEGAVNIWDGSQKKRLRNYDGYQTSIASLSFNCTGTQLAIAASYTFEEGEREYKQLTSHPPDAIYVKTVNEQEVVARGAPRT